MQRNAPARGNLITIALLAASLSFSAGPSATEITRKAQQQIDQVKSLSADFSVRTQLSALKKTSESTGRLFLQRKQNKIRLEQPDQTIVSDGKSVWTYAPANRQIVVTTADQGAPGLRPDELLFQYTRRYTPTLIDQETLNGVACYVLKLTAKDSTAQLRELRIWVDAKQWLTRKVVYSDDAGSETVVTFSAIRLNPSVPADTFRMAVPKDVELVDLR